MAKRQSRPAAAVSRIWLAPNSRSPMVINDIINIAGTLSGAATPHWRAFNA